MSSKLEIVYIYHERCQASLNLLTEITEIKNKFSDIEYIDLSKDKIESSIEIEAVPTLIVDNEKVHVGKQAFDFVRQIANEPVKKQQEPSSKKKNMYSSLYLAPPDDTSSNKKRVTFD